MGRTCFASCCRNTEDASVVTRDIQDRSLAVPGPARWCHDVSKRLRLPALLYRVVSVCSSQKTQWIGYRDTRTGISAFRPLQRTRRRGIKRPQPQLRSALTVFGNTIALPSGDIAKVLAPLIGRVLTSTRISGGCAVSTERHPIMPAGGGDQDRRYP